MRILFLLLLAISSSLAQPASIIVIRHAEKPTDSTDRGLSELGQKRAESLPTFLETSADLKKLGRPAALYATALAERGRGRRCQETLKPLAARLGLVVQAPFKAEENGDLAKQLEQDEALKGRTVLICWTHERIPSLLKALGVEPLPPKLKEDEYDAVYLLTRENHRVDCRTIRQNFQAGSLPPETRSKISVQ